MRFFRTLNGISRIVVEKAGKVLHFSHQSQTKIPGDAVQRHTDVGGFDRWNDVRHLLTGPALEDEGRVVSTEAEGVGEGDVDLLLTRLVRDKV